MDKISVFICCKKSDNRVSKWIDLLKPQDLVIYIVNETYDDDDNLQYTIYDIENNINISNSNFSPKIILLHTGDRHIYNILNLSSDYTFLFSSLGTPKKEKDNEYVIKRETHPKFDITKNDIVELVGFVKENGNMINFPSMCRDIDIYIGNKYLAMMAILCHGAIIVHSEMINDKWGPNVIANILESTGWNEFINNGSEISNILLKIKRDQEEQEKNRVYVKNPLWWKKGLGAENWEEKEWNAIRNELEKIWLNKDGSKEQLAQAIIDMINTIQHDAITIDNIVRCYQAIDEKINIEKVL